MFEGSFLLLSKAIVHKYMFFLQDFQALQDVFQTLK